MKTTLFGMVEIPAPTVKPKEEVWVLCERLAEKHGIPPLEVLKRFVWVGEEAANIEEMGGVITGRVGEKVIEIKVFDNKKS